MKERRFNLCKFCSNRLLLQVRVDGDQGNQAPNQPRELTESNETYASSTLGLGQPMRSGEQKVLGVRWNICSDEFVVSLTEIASAAQAIDPSKHNIVGLVKRFYQPLGILFPVVVRLRCFSKSSAWLNLTGTIHLLTASWEGGIHSSLA